MGWWANKIRCHKIPIIFTLFITIFGNVIYIYLESIRDINDTKKIFSPKAWMLVSRFIMGIGAACAAVIRSYVSSATNLEERTSALANISACQGLGFIM
jgi:ceroid-lipofuscinosis MFS transporter 7